MCDVESLFMAVVQEALLDTQQKGTDKRTKIYKEKKKKIRRKRER